MLRSSIVVGAHWSWEHLVESPERLGVKGFVWTDVIILMDDEKCSLVDYNKKIYRGVILE